MTEPNIIDRFVGWISPEAGCRRAYAREMYASYRGGVTTRLDPSTRRQSAFTGQTRSDARSLASVRDRARRVDEENPIGHGILDRLVDNIIGEGMTLQAKTGSKDFDSEAEDRWKRWEEVCDVRGMFHGAEMQSILQRSHERDGDAGLVLVDRGGESRLQLIEAHQIATPDDQQANPAILNGVEMDRVGRPVAFHVLEFAEGGNRGFSRIPAANFIYYPRLNRYSATRGESCFVQMFPLLDQIDGYVDAVIIAARMAATFGLIFKEANGAQQLGRLGTLTNSQGNQQRAITLENGQAKFIGRDDDIVQVNPQQPMNQTPEFIAAMMRLIGLPINMPLELVMLDFSRVNFSSARASFLQFYRAMKVKQARFRARVMDRIYPWWISREVNAGRFRSAVPTNYWDHHFMARGWQWVDPVAEGQAALLEWTMGTNTLANIAAGQGRDLEEITEERAAELAAFRALNIPITLSSLTRHPFLGVGWPKTPEEAQTDPTIVTDPTPPTEPANPPSEPTETES
jgi:lambda family phage portal protein